ncbi:MAG: hypothetical protein DMG55_16045 [Acidobacteria bacterium]|nr:MAG: hypothetical protein DMG55_16045 [Acidobacteriota bacterium]
MKMLYPRPNPGALRLGRVTPGAVWPARELLGDLLMEMRHRHCANRNTLKGVAETARMPDLSSKSQGYLEFILPADRLPLGLWPSRSPEAGKFSRAVELFYLEFVRQFIEKKDVRIGLGLALRKSVGEANRGSL